MAVILQLGIDKNREFSLENGTSEDLALLKRQAVGLSKLYKYRNRIPKAQIYRALTNSLEITPVLACFNQEILGNLFEFRKSRMRAIVNSWRDLVETGKILTKKTQKHYESSRHYLKTLFSLWKSCHKKYFLPRKIARFFSLLHSDRQKSYTTDPADPLKSLFSLWRTQLLSRLSHRPTVKRTYLQYLNYSHVYHKRHYRAFYLWKSLKKSVAKPHYTSFMEYLHLPTKMAPGQLLPTIYLKWKSHSTLKDTTKALKSLAFYNKNLTKRGLKLWATAILISRTHRKSIHAACVYHNLRMKQKVFSAWESAKPVVKRTWSLHH